MAKCKVQRERLKAEEEVLKGQRGFVNNVKLVADFESRKRYIDELRDQIADLKQQHRLLTLGQPQTD